MDLISRAAAIDTAMNDRLIINAMDSVKDGDMHRTKRAIVRLLASLPTAERVENIPFGKLKAICRYYTLSYDADKGVESACHSTANMKDGESWGKCNEHDCPFWKETENE